MRGHAHTKSTTVALGLTRRTASRCIAMRVFDTGGQRAEVGRLFLVQNLMETIAEPRLKARPRPKLLGGLRHSLVRRALGPASCNMTQRQLTFLLGRSAA